MKATTQDWIDFAKTDLRSCENNLHDDFVTNIVAFHSQQTVEKAFKALLEEMEISVPKVHNLSRLYAIVENFFSDKIEIAELEALDSVYTSSRYPGDIGLLATGKPTLKESSELYECAKKIFNIVLQTIENINNC